MDHRAPSLVFVLTLAACGATPPAHPPDPLAGTWKVAGRYTDGDAYSGTVTFVRVAPDLFTVTWRAPNVSRGVAMRVRDARALVTGYRLRDEVGVGVYVQGDRLAGVWSNGRALGSEDVQVLTDLPAPDDPLDAPPEVGGEWAVDGWEPGADRGGPPTYQATVSVQPRGDGRCSVSWLAPAEAHGVGLLDARANLLAIAYPLTQGLGVLALRPTADGFAGAWTSDDPGQTGWESWRRTASWTPPMGAATAAPRAPTGVTSRFTGQDVPTLTVVNEGATPRTVLLDGQPLGTLEPGAQAEFPVTVGAHTLSMSEAEGETRVSFKGGSAYTYRVTP